MSTFRQMLAYAIALIAYALQAVATTTQLVWKAGRWVHESVASPFRSAPPAPAGASAADAAAALAEAAQAPIGVPASYDVPGYDYQAAGFNRAKDITLEEAIMEYGTLAKEFALSQATVDGVEPSLSYLDEAAHGWLLMLNAEELLTITNSSERLVGLHMMGKWQLPGLSYFPTREKLEEAKAIKAQAQRFAADRIAETRKVTAEILQDLVDHPTWATNPA